MSEEEVNAEMVFFYACLSMSFLYSAQGDTRNMLMWLLFALFFMAWDVGKDDKTHP
ncbi:MAG: hypothetical protein ABIJ47_16560 [Candidatus Bathyarchaeota archaeon]